MAFIDIEHGFAFRRLIYQKAFFFFFVKSRGDQFDDKFFEKWTVVVKSDYSKVKLIEATFFVKKNFKLKFRISVSFIQKLIGFYMAKYFIMIVFEI